MGGPGSTRWGWHTKKHTVEDSRVLDVVSLIKRGVLDVTQPASAGGIAWTDAVSGEERASVSYTMRIRSEYGGVLRVSYSLSRTGQQVVLEIPLTTTRQALGGVRWWAHCPHCGERVAKLYLPPVGIRFLCRRCHNLTYRSAQQAHLYDRSASELLRMMGRYDRLLRQYERLK